MTSEELRLSLVAIGAGLAYYPKIGRVNKTAIRDVAKGAGISMRKVSPVLAVLLLLLDKDKPNARKGGRGKVPQRQ